MAEAHQTEVVVIERQSSVDFLHTLFRCHASGLVAMPLEPGSHTSYPGIQVVERITCAAGGGWFSERIAPRHDRTPAQVVLTSGSTGTPKAILISHAALGDVTTRLVEFMQMDDSVREYVGVPVTYSFGFGRVRAVAAAGGASYLPERGFRIDELAAMLERGEINALSLVPTLLRLVLDQRERFAPIGAALRWLEIGSQPMTRLEKEAVRELFPNARIAQHYGLTEASRTTFLDVSGQQGEALGSVGRAYGAVEIRIDDDGAIAIRGPHVATGVITAQGVQALTDADGWLKTNDLGRIQDGSLYFEGRADDLINVGGIKVPSEVFEDRLRSRIGSQLSYAVAPGDHPLRGQIVLVAYEDCVGADAVEALRAASAQVSREMGVADAVALFPVKEIPRTGTNKIRRSELSSQYSAAMAQMPAAMSAETPETANAGEGILAAFDAKFGKAAADRGASFRSLEGDSLSYIDMMLRLEKYLPILPEDWDAMSIEQLCELADPARGVKDAFVAAFGENACDAGASFESLGGDHSKQDRIKQALQPFLPTLPHDWYNMSIGALSSLAGQPAGSPAHAARRAYRPSNLDTVRGLACVLIVALHVVGVRGEQGLEIARPSLWHGIMDALEVVRLPLFTAMAGYIYGAMPATREGFGPYMKTKLKQLGVPLIFATLFFWTIKKVMFDDVDHDLLMSYVYGYEHLWYIYAILLMFALVSLLDQALRPSVRMWCGFIFAAMVLYWLVPMGTVTYIKKGLLFLPFFLFGIVIQRRSEWMRSPLTTVAALVLLVGSIATIPLGRPEAVGLDQIGLVTWLGGGSAVVLLLLYLPKFVGLEVLAAYSFTIYLWHPAANAALRTVLLKLDIDNLGVLFVSGVLVGVCVPVAMHLAAVRLPKFVSMPIIGK